MPLCISILANEMMHRILHNPSILPGHTPRLAVLGGRSRNSAMLAAIGTGSPRRDAPTGRGVAAEEHAIHPPNVPTAHVILTTPSREANSPSEGFALYIMP